MIEAQFTVLFLNLMRDHLFDSLLVNALLDLGAKLVEQIKPSVPTLKPPSHCAAFDT
jgi:hypothetical protein